MLSIVKFLLASFCLFLAKVLLHLGLQRNLLAAFMWESKLEHLSGKATGLWLLPG